MGCSHSKNDPEIITYSSQPAWDKAQGIFVVDALPVEWKKFLDESGVSETDLEDCEIAARIAETIVAHGWIGMPPIPGLPLDPVPLEHSLASHAPGSSLTARV